MAEAVLALKNIIERNRDTLLLILKVLVAAGLLSLIIREVDPGKIMPAFRQADKDFIIMAFGLSFLNMYLQYLKWKLVCNVMLQENRKRIIFHSLLYGFSFGSFTPARAGEYFGRAIPFSDKPLLDVSMGVLTDKLFSMSVVLLFGSISILLYLNLSIIYSAFILVLSGVFIYTAFKGIRLISPLQKYKWIQKIKRSYSLIGSANNEFRLRLFLLSLFFYICFIIQFVLLIIAFSHHYNYMNYIWTGNLVMFTKTIIPPVSIGELGIREGTTVYFLKHFGENAATGFNASIFLFLINILLPAFTGFIIFLRRK